MTDIPQPLIVCMENMDGEEVSLRISRTDTFQIFLDSAKSLLGYDVDLDSVTGNRPVALDDNIYDFLLNVEENLNESNMEDNKYIKANNIHDREYVLDDGTQIKASQIQFDNDDPIIDLTSLKIPFVKYIDDGIIDIESEETFTMKDFNIPESPKSQNSVETSSPRRDFANSLPFKLFCNNVSNFEAQFTKYLASNSSSSTNLTLPNKSKPQKDYKYDIAMKNCKDVLTREDVLNMFKDSPVTSLPYDANKNYDKRKHSRKSDPARLGHKNSNCKTDTVANTTNNDQRCCICDKITTNEIEKSYIFDKEDQMIHSCDQGGGATQLKNICSHCLGNNFQPSLMKSPSQYLNNDEYLVIQNNQQLIYQKITAVILKKSSVDLETVISNSRNKESVELVKVEIGPDGEIITKPVDNDEGSDDIIFVDDKTKDCYSDVEIIEPDQDCEDIDIEDEALKEFLGKYECVEIAELKCRFCERTFENVSQVVDHGEEHKHDLEDGPVYPCPLCDYGYEHSKWLKAHLKAAHDKVQEKKEVNSGEENKDKTSPGPSPVARRTRSSLKKNDSGSEKGTKDTQETEDNANEPVKLPPLFITEVKQECLDSSDEEAIWIVQAEDGSTQQSEQAQHLEKGKVDDNITVGAEEVHKCFNCNQVVRSAEVLAAHKCKKRGRKRKCLSKDANVLVPSREDFLKRAQGRPRKSNKPSEKESVKIRKKRSKGSCNSLIVTCHNCNESFTSKVRLKFHMQFHEASSMLTTEGEYVCPECEGATFPTETALFDHVHFQHDKQKRWQCPVKDCGKTFFLRATLTKHSRIHTDTRRYVCVTCGKRFLDKQTLDEHGVTHLQIKPFQCHICLKQLTRRSRLRMHLRAHEEELSLKLVLVCAVCSRAFRDHIDAQEHVARSSECLEVFTNELKEDTETERLSPTTGIVMPKDTDKKESVLSAPIEREVRSGESAALLERVADGARSVLRVVNIEKAFRCEYCEDVFYLEEALNKHRIIHKGVKNPFTCHICKVSFATYSRCTTHKTTHGFYKRTTATEAPGGEARGPANAGILGYGGFPVVKHFLCEDCGRSYLHWTYLQVHRRMKHANERYLFRCDHCQLTFNNSWSIAYHRKKIHGKSGSDEGITKIIREDLKIPCRDCEEVLPNKTALYKHRQMEHCDRLGNEDYISEYRDDTATCPKCELDFRTSLALQKHLKEVHAAEGSVGAEETNGAKGQFPCDGCGRAFRSAGARAEHVRVHTGERPFPCDLCGAAFRRSTAMRNHRLIHGGVRAWACPRCPRRFRVRSDLRTHLRLKHPAHLAVIEIEGLNPTSEEVLSYLKRNNINQNKVMEITMISFPKGTTNIVPNSARALSMLSDVRRTRVACESTPSQPLDVFQPTHHSRGIGKGSRPSILQRGTDMAQDYFPITLNDPERLSALNMELLLPEGGLVNGNQMVQLQLDAGLGLD